MFIFQAAGRWQEPAQSKQCVCVRATRDTACNIDQTIESHIKPRNRDVHGWRLGHGRHTEIFSAAKGSPTSEGTHTDCRRLPIFSWPRRGQSVHAQACSQPLCDYSPGEELLQVFMCAHAVVTTSRRKAVESLLDFTGLCIASHGICTLDSDSGLNFTEGPTTLQQVI